MTVALPVETLGCMKKTIDPTDTLATLRDQIYCALHARRDALFELMDATTCGDTRESLVHGCLSPLHRRGHGSLYAAIRRGTLWPDRVRAALTAAPPLTGGLAAYAVDVSVVPRCDAETSPERGYYYSARLHSHGQPIVAGWAYSWIVQIGTERSSWTAPVDVERQRPGERAEAVAVEQIRRLVPLVPPSPIPLFVFDAGYTPGVLTEELIGECVAILVRLRANRIFFRPPPPYPGNGRPRRHGTRFRCADPATWGDPDQTHGEDDPACGHVDVRCWAHLHGAPSEIPGRGTGPGRGPTRAIVTGWVARVVLERTPGQARPPAPLWLWYAGPSPPDLALLWRAYVHRFDIEHTLRFVKQRLGWATARLRTPQQMDTWTWIVVVAYTQLRLARTLIVDRKLPWELARPPNSLTPLRVQRGFGALVAAIGTPASAPKPSGRSPGRPKGRLSTPAPRCPAVKAADARAA